MDDPNYPPHARKPPIQKTRQRQQKLHNDQVFDNQPQFAPQPGSQIVKGSNKIIPKLNLKPASKAAFNDEPQVEIIEDDPMYHKKDSTSVDYKREAMYTEEMGYGGSVQGHAASYNQAEQPIQDDCMVQMSQEDHFSLPTHELGAIKHNFLNNKQEKKPSLMNKLKHASGKRRELYEMDNSQPVDHQEKKLKVDNNIVLNVGPDHQCLRDHQKDVLIHVQQKTNEVDKEGYKQHEKDALYQYNRYEDMFVQLSSGTADKDDQTTVKIGISEDKRWVAEVHCTKEKDDVLSEGDFAQ